MKIILLFLVISFLNGYTFDTTHHTLFFYYTDFKIN